MIEAWFRFYGPLNDFLPRPLRQITFRRAAGETDTLKHVIESIGVPHPEVDAVLVDGTAAPLSRTLTACARVAVYPPLLTLAPPDWGELRFVLDGHLGRLAAFLRMLGFDTRYERHADDEALARESSAGDRILLTRDVALLKRAEVRRGYIVRPAKPLDQLDEVTLRYGLAAAMSPFRRCLECNTPLVRVSKEDIVERLQPLTRVHYDEFRQCPGCERVYWKGSHFARMEARIERLRRLG